MTLLHEHITIPIWKTSGLVVDEQPAKYPEVKVLIERFPDDMHPVWFTIAEGDYFIT